MIRCLPDIFVDMVDTQQSRYVANRLHRVEFLALDFYDNKYRYDS